MNKIKVAIYIRVSSQEQATEGYSIQEQEIRLRQYAEANDWIVYKVYSDPGYSGAKIDRPGLDSLIRDVKREKFSKVIVYKLDRLSRRQRDTLYLIEDIFLPNKVDFISMTESFDTGSPLGRAMIGILSVFAQLERENIRERMQIGHDARAKEGFFHGGGFDPIGYDYINGELVVNEYEALQVRLIYDLYLQGKGVNTIVSTLNNKGYTKKYGKWAEDSVRAVLFGTIYRGVISWKGEEYPGRHQAIVSKEDWDKVQEIRLARLANNPKLANNPFKRTSLLGGLLWCGKCGARYHVKQNTVKWHKTTDPNKKALKYYTCYSRSKTNKRLIKDPNCRNTTYNTAKLDAIIIDEIRKLAFDDNYLESVTNHEKYMDISEDIKVINKRIEDIDNQILKLIDLYQVNNIDFNVINGKIEALNEEKEKLELELDSIERPKAELSLKETKAIIKTIPGILDNGDFEAIKAVVHSLINSIIIKDDDLEIHWKFN